jgi:hypothetical protein
MATTKDKPKLMRARRAFVWVEGARPPIPRTIVTRDRRSGRLARVPLAPIEAPPLDEGDPGVTHVVGKGEELYDDDPVVKAKPWHFVEVVP